MNFVIEIILKSSALLIFILCLLSLLKKQSASLRHFLISLTMIGLLSLPLLIFCLPAIELAWLSNRIVPANIPVSITDEPEHFPKSEIAKAPLIINTEPKQLSETAQISQSSISLPSLSALEWIQVTALGISLFFLLRLMVGIYRIRQISFLGKGLHRDDLDEILNRLSPKNQPGNKVKILISPAVQTPMTWGFNQAYILLPESALRWTKEDLFTVLIHEWAHIQRRDYFFHFLAQVATCLYWYNPLFWILKKQQLLEREKACDEFVVNQGVDPNAYARLLLAFARSIQSKTALTHYALPMAKPGQIKQRIIAILDFNPGKVLLSTMAKFKWSFLFAGALPLIATLSLVAKPLPVELKTLLTENELTIIQVSEMVQETPLQDKTLNDQESEASNPAIHDEFNQNENDSLSYSKPVDKLALKTPLLQSEKRPLEQVSAKINGWFGQWEENGHNIKVWTHGEFQTNSDFLYIFPENADGLIVIEVNKGKTSRRIVLTKAPYDGALIQDYKNGEPNAWSGFLRDDLLLMQFKNEEWQYSFQNLGFWKKKLESIAEKMNNLSDNRLWQPAEAVLEDWKRVIQQYQAEKAKRYLARETMKPYEQKLFALEKGETPEEKISIQTIPYKAPAISPEGKGRERKLGFTKHSKTTSGFSGYDGIGNKFGTVIKGSGKASQLKAFNFHIRHTTFQQVKYQLHLFAMNDDKPAHAIIPEPIPGSFENTKEGWIILDLSKYNVISEGENILAVIEIVETVKKDKEGCLFLSQANPITDFFNAQPELSGYDIWAATFSFYFLTN